MAYDKLCWVADGGIPKTYTATAEATVSGGAFVSLASGGQATTLGSTVSTFPGPNCIRVNMNSTSGTATPPGGVALQTVASGTDSYVTLATEGIFILEFSSTTTAGQRVVSTQSGTELGQVGVLPGSPSVFYTHPVIGFALTQGADGEFGLIRMNI